MAITSVSRLVEVLHQSALLPPEQCAQLAELQQSWPETRGLARALIERGWLTPFQMEYLLLDGVQQLTVGPYQLIDVIGEGAMGKVYKARHRKHGHLVALKVLRPDQRADPKVLKRFRREIKALRRLSHPNIVTVRDVADIDRNGFFAMEYVEGVSVADAVRECRQLPLAPAIDYLRQAAVGLQHAYERGLIHRDIKPGNLLITPPPVPAGPGVRPGRWGVVKLLDLGLALVQQQADERSDSHTRLTAKGLMLGTVDYVAPEQVMNPHEVDIRADLYSLGCTFYEMLCGQPPFPHGSPARKLLSHQEAEPTPVERLRERLPADVIVVVRKLMAKAPSDRFQTPGDLVRTLNTLLQQLPPEDVNWDWRPPNLAHSAAPGVSQLGQAERGRRWWLAAALLLALAGAAAGAVLLTGME